MTSLVAVCRASARLAGNRGVVRNFHASTRCLAAQNFIMPALSPTMTEGNIASWKVKEGDSFSAGDVLLEIETDKATMDVEAQEDGIVMKIISQNGSKAVQVGTRIAVLAEAGDDVGSLELPADEQPKQPTQKASKSDTAEPEKSKSETIEASSKSQKPATTGNYEHKYPLMPSVGQLVKQNGLSKEDVNKIKGTGPQGRLLKGDVLAFLGTINSKRPEALSEHFEKLSHLDLSNIKVAERKVPAAPKPEEKAPAGEAVANRSVVLDIHVSLENVREAQRKVKRSLGVTIPISTFVERARLEANEGLPLPSRPPTANELFDQILGLDKVKSLGTSRGNFTPSFQPAHDEAELDMVPLEPDIIDLLAAPRKKQTSPRPPAFLSTSLCSSDEGEKFILLAKKDDQRRAELFLAHFKALLEDEPSRLVIPLR